MSDRHFLKVLAAAAIVLSVPAAFAADGQVRWGYEGHGRPSHWGDLQEDFATCKLGKEQSPINIATKSAKKAELPPIKTRYRASGGEIVNNGHTIQVDLGNGGSAELSNRVYKLVQFHFHTPSEEKIDGKNYPMVAHLVHRDDAGNLAVVAVLFKRGRENAALKSIFQRLPAKEGEAPLSESIDTTRLLPPNRAYYAFKGSLTTPPCSEGVSWYVLKQAVELSAGQIGAFQKVFKMNARPVQPLNGREVVEAK